VTELYVVKSQYSAWFRY